MSAGAFDDLIDIGEIEMAFLCLKLFPVDRRFDSIGMQRRHGFPYLRQFARPSAGVVNLAAENQIGAAVNQQRVAAIFLNDFWGFGSERVCERDEREKNRGDETCHSERTPLKERTHSPDLLPSKCNRGVVFGQDVSLDYCRVLRLGFITVLPTHVMLTSVYVP